MKCPSCGRPACNGATVCQCLAVAIRAAERKPDGIAEPPREPWGDFVNRYLLTKRAQACARRWNLEHLNTLVPVEWAEEAAIAFCAAKTLGRTPAGLESQERMLEFTTRLPVELVERIFEGEVL